MALKLQSIRDKIREHFPDHLIVEDLSNSDCLVVPHEIYRAVAEFLRDDDELQFSLQKGECGMGAKGSFCLDSGYYLDRTVS